MHSNTTVSVCFESVVAIQSGILWIISVTHRLYLIQTIKTNCLFTSFSVLIMSDFFNFQDGFLEHYLLKLLGKARLRKFVTGHRASLADITALSGQTKLKLLLLWNGLKHDLGTSPRDQISVITSKHPYHVILNLGPTWQSLMKALLGISQILTVNFSNYLLLFLLSEPNSREDIMSTQNPQSMIKKLVPTWRFLKNTSPEKWEFMNDSPLPDNCTCQQVLTFEKRLKSIIRYGTGVVGLMKNFWGEVVSFITNYRIIS